MQQLSKYNVPVSFQAPPTCTGDCKSYSLSLSLASLASFVKEATSFSSKFNFLVRCSHFVLKSLKSIWMWMMQRKFWKPKGPAFVNSNSTAFLLKRYKEISSKVKLQRASRSNFLALPGLVSSIRILSMHDNNTFIYDNHENCDNFENYDNDNDKNFVTRINLARVDYRDENDDSDSDDKKIWHWWESSWRELITGMHCKAGNERDLIRENPTISIKYQNNYHYISTVIIILMQYLLSLLSFNII